MRVMVIVDHPYGVDSWDNTPHHRSFTAALAHAACQGLAQAGHEIDLVDLHADGFNPVVSAQELTAWRKGEISPDPLTASYQSRLLAADHLLFVFPIWWEAMPAATKGFIDKVMAKDIAYKFTDGPGLMVHTTKLTGVTMITVMATPDQIYRSVYGSAIETILLKGTFEKIGIPNLTWLSQNGAESMSLEERQQILADTQAHFANLA